jgi:hypothetical protein
MQDCTGCSRGVSVANVTMSGAISVIPVFVIAEKASLQACASVGAEKVSGPPFMAPPDRDERCFGPHTRFD